MRISRQHKATRRAWGLVACGFAFLLVACGAREDAGNGTPAVPATGTATALATTRFVQSQDQVGPGIWHPRESVPGLAIGVLCSDLGGGSKLGVNGEARSPASAMGSRFVAVAREGTWILWLANASSEALPRAAPQAVMGQELVARIEQGLMLGPGDPYLACN